jgi:drug/metabolite transporter (DMT)-like permease
MSITPWLWVIFTVTGAAGQSLRNAMQKELITTIGTAGATYVRFLYGLPFAALFLAAQLAVTGAPLPAVSGSALAWTLLGALSQIGATGLMLAAMKERSFVVTTALTKIEPVWVALLGIVFIGDHLTWPLAGAIVVATTGVMVMSWPRAAQVKEAGWSWRPALLGVVSGLMFAIAAIGYRGGIRAMTGPSFVLNATTILVLGLLLQTALITLYLVARDREKLAAILRAWKPSLFAGFMGAFASQCWFLAFALESAARVRTLGLVEILFAQLLSRSVFRQSLSSREGLGILLVIVGVVWLLNV